MRYLAIITLFGTACALVAQPAAANDREQRIESCRKLVASIERHEQLRRRGGRIGEMESWKRRIRADQDRYTDLNCKQLRRHLRASP